ncbi:transmembrane protein 214-A-like [Petromyzon marinus]|uniref:transmembrane protein 214-A-like n=1 Tax=Petromyzon marinus TaxID=7757 RepID=UPI003F6FDE69
MASGGGEIVVGGGGGGGGGGKWEVVKGKKSNGVRGKPSRPVAVTLGPMMGPIKTSETMFELAFDREKKSAKEQPLQQPPPQQQQNIKKASAKQSKKANGDASPSGGRFATLEDALKALDLKDMKTQLDKSQAMFMEEPTVWVKDIAGYLNLKLQAPESDPALSRYPHDYPLCLAKRELRAVVLGLLQRCGPGGHCTLLQYSLAMMLRESDKPSGESVHGYRLCVQFVLSEYPDVVEVHMTENLKLLNASVNKTNKCLSLLWALNQSGEHDLAVGLRVWVEAFLPLIEMKPYSAYVISSLHHLLHAHGNLSRGFGIVTLEQFLSLLELAFASPSTALAPGPQKQLQVVYPRLKELVLRGCPDAAPPRALPVLLARLAATARGSAQARELLGCLVEGLASGDAEALAVWRGLYADHLAPSSLLLQHLLKNWSSVSGKVSQQELRQSVLVFAEANKQMALQSRRREGLKESTAACAGLLEKMKAKAVPWRRYVMAGVFLLCCFLAQDVWRSGSMQDSTSARLLRETGIAEAAQRGWAVTTLYSAWGYSWLQESVPPLWARACGALGPWAARAWDAAAGAGALLWARGVEPAVAWTAEGLHAGLKTARAELPALLEEVARRTQEVAAHVHQRYLLPVLHALSGSGGAVVSAAE